MFSIENLVRPETIEEAYEVLVSGKTNAVLGGCAFLRLGSQRISTAIDLSRLNLNYINEQADYIEIGAMATLRELEINPLLSRHFNGVLPKAAANIIGVQFRNIATVGASVYSKYGFSDIITPLLTLDTEVELSKVGRMPLAEFLDRSYERDILTRIFIRKNERIAAYHSLRTSASDYPVLNTAVSSLKNQWRIVVGARPSRASIASAASAELSQGPIDTAALERISSLAAQELSFGTNGRGKAAYRQAMCSVLVKRAVWEVLNANSNNA